MKNINKLIYVAFSATLLFTSCDSLLDEDPKYTLNTKTIFSDKTAAETSLNQCYGHLANENLYGQALSEATIANGFSWAKTDGNSRERNVSYDSFAEDASTSRVWKGLYKVIAESNYFIDGINKSGFSTENKDRFLAHAYFLRGFAYYKLANLFGKALIITEPISTENLQAPINTRAEVYQQALSDLSFAEKNMPEQQEEKVGFATKQTVQAYLAKCYWLMASQKQGAGEDATELLNKAKMYGDMVINSGKYMLESNYADLFGSHVGGSKESIFQINYSFLKLMCC